MAAKKRVRPAPRKERAPRTREEVAQLIDSQEDLDAALSRLREVDDPVPQPRDRGRGGDRKGGCQSDACIGEGRGSHYERSDSCPSPCDETQYKDWAHDEAKKQARRAARVNCRVKSLNDSCDCKDGVATFLRKECVSIEIGGVKYCAYDLYYRYQGRCED